MFAVFLVFLSIWPVDSVLPKTKKPSLIPKCPEGYSLFQRVPSDRNSLTKFWCLGVFNATHDIRNREWARSTCSYFNGSLSIPQNEKEADFLSDQVNKDVSVEFGFAMDGEITPRCKALHYHFKTDFNKPGECNVESGLFAFQDRHTDPTFIRKHFPRVPSASRALSFESSPMFKEIAACAVLTQKWNLTKVTYADVVYCSVPEDKEHLRMIYSAVCGTLPMWVKL